MSSTLPICDLFSKYTGALKYGIFSFVHLQTKSPSQVWSTCPSSVKNEKNILVIKQN